MKRSVKLVMGAGAALGLLAAFNDRVRWNVGPAPRWVEGESHFYQWREGAISYQVAGPADAPALLLLHAPGLAASSYEFRRVFGPLAQDFRVYLPDLLGYGRSERPSIRYTADTYVDLWSDFARDVIDRPAHIVASGLSCAHVIAAAARHGGRFGKLILLGPVGAGELPGWRRIAGAPLHAKLRIPIVGTAAFNLLVSKAPLSYYLCQYVYGTPCALTEATLADYYTVSHQPGAKWAPAAWAAGRLYRDVSIEFVVSSNVGASSTANRHGHRPSRRRGHSQFCGPMCPLRRWPWPAWPWQRSSRGPWWI